jgi:cell division septal protein FtsQ
MPVAAPADKRFRRAQSAPPRRRRGWTAHWKLLARLAGSLVFFGGGAYVVTDRVAHAEMLHVSRIEVTGNERLATRDVLALLDGLRGQHVLALDLERWRRQVLSSSWVEHAAIRRVLPATVEVRVEERQPIAIARVSGDLYLVDRLGRVIDAYGPKYAQFDLPIVDGLGSKPVAGEPLLDEERAGLAHQLLEAVRPREALFRRVSQIDVSNAQDAVVLLEGDTARLHLGDARFAERLEAYLDLAPVLREQVQAIDYVDLRFESRVYVRPAAARRSAPDR